jgi:hypothetical protein
MLKIGTHSNEKRKIQNFSCLWLFKMRFYLLDRFTPNCGQRIHQHEILFNLQSKNQRFCHNSNFKLERENMRNPTNTNSASGGKSRSVHPNNMKRKGAAAASFDKPQHVQVTKKMKQTMEEACRPQIHLFSEEIVHAGPGPSSKKPRLVSERRPTIPNVPQNSNILGQTILQAGANHSNLVNEIKTRSKVASFATDFEHIQLL